MVADYRGLTVSDIGKVRRELRGKGISYRVVKNRLGKIAAEQADRQSWPRCWSGRRAVALGGEDEAALATGAPRRASSVPARSPCVARSSAAPSSSATR